MIARAPGKLVLSGSYSVLEGAPALVAAVDRYAVADGEQAAPRVTEEVRAAIEGGEIDRAAWFDAAALRAQGAAGESRKLGLGSSAAILVASMAARGATTRRERGEGPPWIDREAIFAGALAAHRRAQGGGSGVDVAASVHGGVLLCRLDVEAHALTGAGAGAHDAAGARVLAGAGAPLSAAPHALPMGGVIAVLASASEARTSAMLERVRALAARDPSAYRALMDEAAGGARDAVAARTVEALATALDRQVDALAVLGDLAGAPIVTAELRRLRAAAAAEGAALSPSGAGGGDVAIFVGAAAPSGAFLAAARGAGLELEPMALGATGVHVITQG